MTLLELSPPVNKTGTYAAVTFSKDTLDRLLQFCEEFGVKNVLKRSKFHTTLLYSRKEMPDYKALGDLDEPLVGKPDEFDVWKTRSEDPNKPASNCLVLKYSCPALEARHKALMKEHKGTYDFDHFQPHITLSYNIGDMDIKELASHLKGIGDIEIVHEYTEQLNLDWASKA
jgi:hypothetical protein